MRYTRQDRLKIRLKRLGCTQQELADALCYSRGYVSSVLNGRENRQCLEAMERQISRWEEAAGK